MIGKILNNGITMEERTVTIRNKTGLHMRPAGEMVRIAARFDSEISITKDELSVNGKSIIAVISLAAESGAAITIQADGEDAQEAVDALVKMVESNFGEDE